MGCRWRYRRCSCLTLLHGDGGVGGEQHAALHDWVAVSIDLGGGHEDPTGRERYVDGVVVVQAQRVKRGTDLAGGEIRRGINGSGHPCISCSVYWGHRPRNGQFPGRLSLHASRFATRTESCPIWF